MPEELKARKQLNQFSIEKYGRNKRENLSLLENYRDVDMLKILAHLVRFS